MNTAYLAICDMAEGLYCFNIANSVISTAVIGLQEVMIININGPLLEDGMHVWGRGSSHGGKV